MSNVTIAFKTITVVIPIAIFRDNDVADMGSLVASFTIKELCELLTDDVKSCMERFINSVSEDICKEIGCEE